MHCHQVLWLPLIGAGSILLMEITELDKRVLRKILCRIPVYRTFSVRCGQARAAKIERLMS